MVVTMPIRPPEDSVFCGGVTVGRTVGLFAELYILSISDLYFSIIFLSKIITSYHFMQRNEKGENIG